MVIPLRHGVIVSPASRARVVQIDRPLVGPAPDRLYVNHVSNGKP